MRCAIVFGDPGLALEWLRQRVAKVMLSYEVALGSNYFVQAL